MHMTVVRRSPPLRFAPRRVGWDDLLGIGVGLVLPLVAAALYRTYGLMVAPTWMELTRQLGLPFVAGEIVVILFARRKGFDPVALVRGLPRLTKGALALFAGTFWISSIFVSQATAFSSAMTLIWLVHLLFGAAVYHVAAIGGRFRAARFARGFVIGLAALAVVTAVHFLFPPADLAIVTGYHGWGSAIPGFISNRLFGAWAAAVLALLLGLAWQRRPGDRASRWLYPAIGLAAGLALWSGTRAAILGAGGALVVAWLLSGPPAARDFKVKAPIAILIAAVAATVLIPYDDPSYMIYRPGDTGSAEAFTSGRTVFWASALRVASGYPVFGAGAGACWWLVPLDGHYHVQPHNALVQFLLSWGLVPTLAAVTLLAQAIWRVHRIARDHRGIVPLVMMLDCLLAMSMVDGMLYFSRFLMLVCALFGLCLAQGRAGRSV